MERNYTESIRLGYFDMIQSDTSVIWDTLKKDKAAFSNEWKKRYLEVVSRYRLSCRFALMRLLFEKASGLPPAKIDENALREGFDVEGIGSFPDISITHSDALSDEEINDYKRLLLRRAEENNPAFYREAESLIDRALSLPAQGRKSPLTREEIIRLGHMEAFSLDDMQFLLLRVLGDNEASFSYSASEDVIDMYGFVTNAHIADVERIKAWYRENAAALPKVSYEEKPVYCTRDIAYSIKESFSGKQVDAFQTWLRERAPFLDIKSKTARNLYLNLAAYAYVLSQGPGNGILSELQDGLMTGDFYNDIEALTRHRGYHPCARYLFFRNSAPDVRKCQKVADALLYENAELANGFHSHTKNAQLFYHIPYVQDGKVTVRGRLNAKSKERIVAILTDAATPKKSDLLYLLWFTANCYWIDYSGQADEKAVFLDDFVAAASCLLEAALLPEFYPPCVLETTMMLAIAQGNEDRLPSAVYESICSSFTNQGAAGRTIGAKSKTNEHKKEIVEYYYKLIKSSEYKTRTECKKVCAQKYAISVKSVEGYERQYRNGKL